MALYAARVSAQGILAHWERGTDEGSYVVPGGGACRRPPEGPVSPAEYVARNLVPRGSSMGQGANDNGREPSLRLRLVAHRRQRRRGLMCQGTDSPRGAWEMGQRPGGHGHECVCFACASDMVCFAHTSPGSSPIPILSASTNSRASDTPFYDLSISSWPNIEMVCIRASSHIGLRGADVQSFTNTA